MSNWTPPPIRTRCDSRDPAIQSIAQKIFLSLDLAALPAIASDDDTSNNWLLIYEHPVLRLSRTDHVFWQVDFTSGKAMHRTREAGQGIATLAKALGLKTFRKRHQRAAVIVDATAGWGQDAWALASLGHCMTLIETHPIVHALLENGLQRARDDEQTTLVAQRIELIQGDSAQRLAACSGDVIYLDPMYPPRARKKAHSKKPMQFLHELLGPADESVSQQLLEAALATTAHRVVVKRPKGAASLTPPGDWQGQQMNVTSPNTRYDVYLPTR